MSKFEEIEQAVAQLTTDKLAEKWRADYEAGNRTDLQPPLRTDPR